MVLWPSCLVVVVFKPSQESCHFYKDKAVSRLIRDVLS